MLTIKNFEKGDTVCRVTMNRGRNTKPSICEETVTSVGRTYVTTTGVNAWDHRWSHRYMNHDAEYLFEKVEYGDSSYLFKTKEDAEEYIEKCDLALWLGGISVSKAAKYSIEQLRQVKAILHE